MGVLEKAESFGSTVWQAYGDVLKYSEKARESLLKQIDKSVDNANAQRQQSADSVSEYLDLQKGGWADRVVHAPANISKQIDNIGAGLTKGAIENVWGGAENKVALVKTGVDAYNYFSDRGLQQGATDLFQHAWQEKKEGWKQAVKDGTELRYLSQMAMELGSPISEASKALSEARKVAALATAKDLAKIAGEEGSDFVRSNMAEKPGEKAADGSTPPIVEGPPFVEKDNSYHLDLSQEEEFKGTKPGAPGAAPKAPAAGKSRDGKVQNAKPPEKPSATSKPGQKNAVDCGEVQTNGVDGKGGKAGQGTADAGAGGSGKAKPGAAKQAKPAAAAAAPKKDGAKEPEPVKPVRPVDELDQAKEMAKFSDSSYADSGAPPGSHRLTEDELPASLRKQMTDSHGFQSALYRTDDGRLVLAFRGTEEGKDAVADVRQGLGYESSQYNQAVRVAKLVKQEFPNDQVQLTGHSLGGGLAQLASAATGYPATTFNAAGVHSATYDRYGLKPNDDQIVNYHVAGDPLTGLQSIKTPDIHLQVPYTNMTIDIPSMQPAASAGRQVTLPAPNRPDGPGVWDHIFHPIDSVKKDAGAVLDPHRMQSVNDSIDLAIQQRDQRNKEAAEHAD